MAKRWKKTPWSTTREPVNPLRHKSAPSPVSQSLYYQVMSLSYVPFHFLSSPNTEEVTQSKKEKGGTVFTTEGQGKRKTGPCHFITQWRLASTRGNDGHLELSNVLHTFHTLSLIFTTITKVANYPLGFRRQRHQGSERLTGPLPESGDPGLTARPTRPGACTVSGWLHCLSANASSQRWGFHALD